MTYYEDPAQAGRAAHTIRDWVRINGRLYVCTARFGWHAATQRERGLVGQWSQRRIDEEEADSEGARFVARGGGEG